MQQFKIMLSDEDAQELRQALQFRQAKFRRENGLIIPPGEGDLSGRLLAEICRGWRQFVLGPKIGELTDRDLYRQLNVVEPNGYSSEYDEEEDEPESFATDDDFTDSASPLAGLVEPEDEAADDEEEA